MFSIIICRAHRTSQVGGRLDWFGPLAGERTELVNSPLYGTAPIALIVFSGSTEDDREQKQIAHTFAKNDIVINIPDLFIQLHQFSSFCMECGPVVKVGGNVFDMLGKQVLDNASDEHLPRMLNF